MSFYRKIEYYFCDTLFFLHYQLKKSFMSKLNNEQEKGILVKSVVYVKERMEFSDWMINRVKSIHFADNSKMNLAFEKINDYGINRPSATKT